MKELRKNTLYTSNGITWLRNVYVDRERFYAIRCMINY